MLNYYIYVAHIQVHHSRGTCQYMSNIIEREFFNFAKNVEKFREVFIFRYTHEQQVFLWKLRTQNS